MTDFEDLSFEALGYILSGERTDSVDRSFFKIELQHDRIQACPRS